MKTIRHDNIWLSRAFNGLYYFPKQSKAFKKYHPWIKSNIFRTIYFSKCFVDAFVCRGFSRL